MSDTQAFLACDKCPRLFKSQEYRELHEKVHEMKRPRVCHICKAVFGATKGLEEHLLSHAPKSNVTNPDVVRVLASHQITLPPSTELVIKTINPKSNPLNGGTVKGEHVPHKTLKKSLNGQGKVTNGHSTGKKHTMSSNECSCFACTMSLKSENGKSNDVKCLKAFIPHTCEVCGHFLSSQSEFIDHMNSEHSHQPSPACEVCQVEFTSTSFLKQHLTIHINADFTTAHSHPLQCHICGVTFSTVAALSRHLNSPNYQLPHRCDVCGGGFESSGSRFCHLKYYHQWDEPSNLTKRCKICNSDCSTPSDISIHKFCEKYLFTDWQLFKSLPGYETLKLKYDLTNDYERLRCHFCPITFTKKVHLYGHLREDHGVETAECSYCFAKFHNLNHLYKHICASHAQGSDTLANKGGYNVMSRTGANPILIELIHLECLECMQNFSEQRFINNHMLVFHKSLGRRVNPVKNEMVELAAGQEDSDKFKFSQVKGFYVFCGLCKKVFTNQVKLTLHIMTRHAYVKAAVQVLLQTVGEPCSVQEIHSSAFTNPYEDTFPFQNVSSICLISPQSVKPKNVDSKRPQPQGLVFQNHRKTPDRLQSVPKEVSGKSYKCIVCRQKFPAKSFLFDHFLLSHTSQLPPYSCSRCDFEATNSNDLYRHIVNHSRLDQEGTNFFEQVGLSMKKQDGIEKNGNQNEGDDTVENFDQVSSSSDDDCCVDILNMSSTKGFYPMLTDFSLPFTIANSWKSKASVVGPKIALQILQYSKRVEKYEKNVKSGAVKDPVVAQPLPKRGKRKRGAKPASSVGIQSKKQKSSTFSGDVTIGNEGISMLYLPNLTCKKCDRQFSSLFSYNRHMIQHWSCDKKCPVCHLELFVAKMDFQIHLKSHSGEEQFTCYFCDQSFILKNQLTQHILNNTCSRL